MCEHPEQYQLQSMLHKRKLQENIANAQNYISHILLKAVGINTGQRGTFDCILTLGIEM